MRGWALLTICGAALGYLLAVLSLGNAPIAFGVSDANLQVGAPGLFAIIGALVSSWFWTHFENDRVRAQARTAIEIADTDRRLGVAYDAPLREGQNYPLGRVEDHLTRLARLDLNQWRIVFMWGGRGASAEFRRDIRSDMLVTFHRVDFEAITTVRQLCDAIEGSYAELNTGRTLKVEIVDRDFRPVAGNRKLPA